MIFSLPALLPWLAAAALPWVLHLFLFRKAEQVYFPSLFFLRQCFGWSNRLKLHKLLLLLTRSALILYFILGMLEPRIEKDVEALSGGREGPVLIVLDDRPAMRMRLMARTDNLLESYRQAVIEELERMPQAQPVSVLSLSDLTLNASVRMGTPQQAFGKIRSAAGQTLASPAEEVLRKMLDRFSGQIVFYSPFQLNLRHPRLRRAGPALACEPNLTMISLSVPEEVMSGEPIAVRTTLVDAYSRPADGVVRLNVDGQDVATAAAVQGVASFLLTAMPPGKYMLTAEIVSSGRDGYPDDDRRSARVVVKQDRPIAFAARTIPKPLEAALRAFGNSDVQPRISRQDWESKKRVVVLDLDRIDPVALQRGLQRGLDVIVFSDALPQGIGLSSLIPGMKWESSADAAIASIDANALQQVWISGSGRASANLGFSENRFINVLRKIKISAGPRDKILVSFVDGVPAIVRRPVAQGSITVVSLSIDDPIFQSDPAFLLFVQGLLSSDEPPPSRSYDAVFRAVALNTNAAIPMGPEAPAAQVRLAGSGSSNSLTLGYAQGQFFAELPQPAPAPGVYRLLIGNEERGQIHLYADPPPPLAIASGRDSAKMTMPFDSFFFWIAVLLMAVELLLLRMLRTPSHAI